MGGGVLLIIAFLKMLFSVSYWFVNRKNMKTNKETNWKLYLWYAFLILSIPVAIIPMVLCALGNPMDADPSYFLSIMERISEGKVLYKEVHCGYPPVWFYMTAAVKWLFHIPSGCEEPYYVFHFLMEVLTAVVLYKMIRCMEIDRRIAYFCSWLFVMMGHWMQANYLILEPLTIAFGLLSLWIVMKHGKGKIWPLFAAGMAASSSFLCKQYGLGYLFLCLMLMLFYCKSDAKRVVVFLMGFIAPLLVCLTIWGSSFVNNVFLNGYGSSVDETNGIMLHDKIHWIFGAAKMLFVRCAIALPVSLLFMPFFFKEKKGFLVLFCWCGILGFLMPFYLNFGIPRYLLFSLPFVALLFALTISLLHESKKILQVVFLISLSITVAYSIYADYHNRVWKIYLHRDLKETKEEVAQEISKLIPEGATLWIPNSGLCWAYYLTNATPPNLNTISYAFGAGLTENKAVEQAKAADFVLSFDWEVADPYFTEELKDFVYSHEAVFVSTETHLGSIMLHDMSKMKKE